MESTSKIVLIDNNTNDIYILGSKGVLSEFMNVPYNTVVNWFRDGVKKVNRDNYTIYTVDYVISKSLPSRPDRKRSF